MIVRGKYTFTPTCDLCGVKLEPELDFQFAVSAMRLAGWATIRPDTICSEWYNFCPVCKERKKNNG